MKNGRDISQFEVIGQLRFPMIVLVTFAHSYGKVADDFSLLFSNWSVYEFLKLLVSQTLVKVAVPVFFIMSGYLFFRGLEQWNRKVWIRKLVRRISTLLLPYLLWNLLMALKLHDFNWHFFWDYDLQAGMQIDWFGNEQWLIAPANLPLWFLRDLMVMALVSPIIWLAVKRIGIWLMTVLTVVYLSGVCAFIPGLSAYAIYFFTFGAFLSIRQKDLVATMQHVEIPAYIVTIVLGVGMLLTYHMPVFSSLMLAFRITGAVSVFCLATRMLSHTQRRLPEVVCNASYFVYLAHYVFFLSFVDEIFFSLYGHSEVSLSIHYLLCPTLKVAIFVVVYALYRRLRTVFSF